jgi:predicted RNA-binding Zn-ribbon protein involved in translation (DUF1610 family)
MALATRVLRLEHARRGGGPPRCPDCGGGDEGDERWSATVEWLALGEAGAEPETCPACGQESFIVVWED